jgi:hypothetical protein
MSTPLLGGWPSAASAAGGSAPGKYGSIDLPLMHAAPAPPAADGASSFSFSLPADPRLPRSVLLAVSLRRAHRTRQCASVPASLAFYAFFVVFIVLRADIPAAYAVEGGIINTLQFDGKPGPYAEPAYAATTPAEWMAWAETIFCHAFEPGARAALRALPRRASASPRRHPPPLSPPLALRLLPCRPQRSRTRSAPATAFLWAAPCARWARCGW